MYNNKPSGYLTVLLFNQIMGPLTVRITAAFDCFVIMVILAVLCFVLFMCNNNTRTNSKIMRQNFPGFFDLQIFRQYWTLISNI